MFYLNIDSKYVLSINNVFKGEKTGREKIDKNSLIDVLILNNNIRLSFYLNNDFIDNPSDEFFLVDLKSEIDIFYFTKQNKNYIKTDTGSKIIINDNFNHTVEYFGEYKDNEFILLDSSVTHSITPKVNNYNLPFLFFEKFCYFVDVDEYLSNEMIENKNMLKRYLGNYICAFPPPKDCEGQVGLLYKIKENKYKAEYFTTTINNNKISNISKI